MCKLKHSSSRADQNAGIAKEELRASSMAEMIGAPELEGTKLLRRFKESLSNPPAPPYIHPDSTVVTYYLLLLSQGARRLQPYDQRRVPTSTAGGVHSGTTPELAPEVCPNTELQCQCRRPSHGRLQVNGMSVSSAVHVPWVGANMLAPLTG